MDALTIEKLPHGGFVVYNPASFTTGRMTVPLYACTTIAEALDFIRQRLEKPVAA